jgi:hypothetical protein
MWQVAERKSSPTRISENRAQTLFSRKTHIQPVCPSDQSLKTVPSAAQRRFNRRIPGSITEFSDLPQKVVKTQSPKNPRSQNARDTELTEAE